MTGRNYNELSLIATMATTNRHIEQCRVLMKKSLQRIQKKSIEMEKIGTEVLHELHRQETQMVRIILYH